MSAAPELVLPKPHLRHAPAAASKCCDFKARGGESSELLDILDHVGSFGGDCDPVPLVDFGLDNLDNVT